MKKPKRMLVIKGLSPERHEESTFLCHLQVGPCAQDNPGAAMVEDDEKQGGTKIANYWHVLDLHRFLAHMLVPTSWPMFCMCIVVEALHTLSVSLL